MKRPSRPQEAIFFDRSRDPRASPSPPPCALDPAQGEALSPISILHWPLGRRRISETRQRLELGHLHPWIPEVVRDRRHPGLEPALLSPEASSEAAARKGGHTVSLRRHFFILHLFTSSCAFTFFFFFYKNMFTISFRKCRAQAPTTHLKAIAVILRIECL